MYYILLAAKQCYNKLISVFVHRASRFGVPIFIGAFWVGQPFKKGGANAPLGHTLNETVLITIGHFSTFDDHTGLSCRTERQSDTAAPQNCRLVHFLLVLHTHF